MLGSNTDIDKQANNLIQQARILGASDSEILQALTSKEGSNNDSRMIIGLLKLIASYTSSGGGATDEQVASAVTKYLTDNPVQAYDDSEIKGEIGELKEDLSKEITNRNSAISKAVNEEKNRAVARENEIEELFTLPTQEAVNKWLDEHPEATTTVQDGVITELKIHSDFLPYIKKDYVTPQMFGAKGDGSTDDTDAIKLALAYAETSHSNTLTFPDGIYNVSYGGIGDAIFNGKFVSIVGTGKSMIYVTDCPNDVDLFHFTNCNKYGHGYITGLSFDFANRWESCRYVFNFTFTDNANPLMYQLKVENNTFYPNASYKIFASGTDAGCFNSCNFNYNIAYGLFIKCNNWGDSNKINHNSLFGAGAENRQLNDYVVNLKQQKGSAGCQICGNNCSSGLGRFESFTRTLFSNNQIENVSQTWLDYMLKIVNGNNILIEASNINSNIGGSCLYVNSLATTVQSCGISTSNALGNAKLITQTIAETATIVRGCRGAYEDKIYYGTMPKGSCSGKVTSCILETADKTVNSGLSFVDSNMVAHFFSRDTGIHTISPFTIEGISANDVITMSDGTQLKFVSQSGFQFLSVPKIPLLLDTADFYKYTDV